MGLRQLQTRCFQKGMYQWELVVDWGWSSQAFTEQGSPLPTKGVCVLEPAIPRGLGSRGMEVRDSLLSQPTTKGSAVEQ